MPKEDDKKDERIDSASPVVKRATKAVKKAGGKADKTRKDQAQIEAEEKAAKEAEEEQKLKEADQARKQAEEAARAAYKPKVYTDEEKAEWAKQQNDFEQFFSSIVLRQSQGQS